MDFKKLNEGFADFPVVSGPNVFLRAEYQQESGISMQYANLRLKRLADQGVVRRVRTRRNGKLLQAWEFIGKATK